MRLSTDHWPSFLVQFVIYFRSLISLRAYSKRFLMLRNHTRMVVPHAFHSCWRLDAHYSVVKRRFSILCSDLNFPFCICCLFGGFSSVLSFLCVTAPNHPRQTSYIILQKDIICWSMGRLRWVVSKKKPPSHYLITLGPLNSWLTRNVSRTLLLSNGLLNTVGAVPDS